MAGLISKTPSHKPFTVLVEGNIGAGKTTFLNHFKKCDDVCIYTEPIEKWCNVRGYNLLASDITPIHSYDC